MIKINQRKSERDLQRALAIEYAKNYCQENNLSVEKLKSQRFILSCNECAFAQSSNAISQGLTNDQETMPKVTLMIIFENEFLRIEETEYTRQYLSI